jgi:capsular exopolysaccharide synthesis family protein
MGTKNGFGGSDMSRIFDALNKGKGDTTDFVPAGLFDEEPAPDAAPEYQTAPPMPSGSLITNVMAVAEGDPVLTEVQNVLLPVPAVSMANRTVSLRIPASAPLLPFEAHSSRASEQYRAIRTKLFQHPRQPKIIVVSSAGPGDGKSITAANLAGAVSLKAGARVLLLDADCRRSSLPAKLGIPEAPGLMDFLAGERTLEESIVRTEQFPNLYVMAAGKRRPNPVELLDHPAWLDLCKRLRQEFTHTIIDTPPIHAVADYDLIQEGADGIIVIVRPDHTKRTVLEHALAAVPPAKFLGLVVNCANNWFGRTHYNYDPYYYEAE